MTFYGVVHDFIVNERMNGYFQLRKSCSAGTAQVRFLPQMALPEPSDIDLYLFARLLNPDDEAPIDYYAIPAKEVACVAWTMHLQNGVMDAYRFTRLDRLAAHIVSGKLRADSFKGVPRLLGGNHGPKDLEGLTAPRPAAPARCSSHSPPP